MESAPPRGVREEKILTFFDTGLRLKAVGSSLELIAGCATAFLPSSLVVNVAALVTQNELTSDPNDTVATSIQEAAQLFSLSNHVLIGLYLVLRGIIKLALIYGIFKGKRVAYLFFMASLFIFGGYEAYRGLLRGETLLLALAAFDFLMLILTAHEYRRPHLPTPAEIRKVETD
ncbi:MAG TPA: DUF2127 domain-containing protein [Candidatus Paceibacterota bacterium]|nr:DUF2127 domain-containing protein [Candidatus Paceibacterota bacterium]